MLAITSGWDIVKDFNVVCFVAVDFDSFFNSAVLPVAKASFLACVQRLIWRSRLSADCLSGCIS